jgi:hypothetical protein
VKRSLLRDIVTHVRRRMVPSFRNVLCRLRSRVGIKRGCDYVGHLPKHLKTSYGALVVFCVRCGQVKGDDGAWRCQGTGLTGSPI